MDKYNNNTHLDEEFDIPDDMFDSRNTPNNSYQDLSGDTDVQEKPLSKKEAKARAKAEAKAAKENKAKAKNSKTSKDTVDEQPKVKPDYILYVVSDRITHGTLPYMRNSGLKVTGIFDQIDVLRNKLLMQFNSVRIVVIDSGTGKFVTPTIRKELIDMIGVNDENIKFTVFYTDSVLKSDAMEELGKAAKSVEWIKYKGTPVVVATMLLHDENYVYDLDGDGVPDDNQEIDILGYVGLPTRGCELEKTGVPAINPSIVYRYMEEKDEASLRKFTPRVGR